MRDGYEPPERKRFKSRYVPTRASSCVRKSPYTQYSVLAAIAIAEKERNVKLYSYKCIYCEMWHLTSRKPE